MKKMIEPEIEIVEFDSNDVITTSDGCPLDECILVCDEKCLNVQQ